MGCLVVEWMGMGHLAVPWAKLSSLAVGWVRMGNVAVGKGAQLGNLAVWDFKNDVLELCCLHTMWNEKASGLSNDLM